MKYEVENADFWINRTKKVKALNFENKIVLLGNSLTQGLPIEEFNSNQFVNAGVGGDWVQHIHSRTSPILKAKPKAIFLMAGINDLLAGRNAQDVILDIKSLFDELQKSPTSLVVIHSVLPVNIKDAFFIDNEDLNNDIISINKVLKKLCEERQFIYSDLHILTIKEGNLNAEYTTDGVHLNAEAYAIWIKEIEKILSNRLE